MTKNLKTSIIISILYIGIIRLMPIWERHPGNWWNLLYYLVIVVLFFWILTKIVIEIISLIRIRKEFQTKMLIPIAIMALVIFDGFYNPFRIDLDKIYGKVVFRACYEGTQNQATFKLRDSGKFDIHWTGVFFADNFYTGDFKRTGDTIFMSFKTKTPRPLGDTLLIKNEIIYVIKHDTILSTHFYLGYCKGLN
jgi:hypothetical protein